MEEISDTAGGYSMRPIGILRSPFKEKFGIPRQSGLVTAARARLELLPPFDREEALRGLEEFSHLWLLFVFHDGAGARWRPTVRPPRLGGNQRLGVFATRSGFRPNRIGLSVGRLEAIASREGRLGLDLRGLDLLDGTPVLDVKPYLPYADSPPEATGGFAQAAPEERLEVVFEPAAMTAVEERGRSIPELRTVITQLLSTDPRPAYYGESRSAQTLGIRLFDFDLKWRVEDGRAVVLELAALPDAGPRR